MHREGIRSCKPPRLHCLQICTPCSPVPVTCSLQAKKQSRKQQRETAAVVRQPIVHTFFVVLLFARPRRAAWWGHPFSLWKDNAFWQNAHQCLDCFTSYLRKCECKNSHGVFIPNRTTSVTVTFIQVRGFKIIILTNLSYWNLVSFILLLLVWISFVWLKLGILALR